MPHRHSHLTRRLVLPLPAGEGRGEGDRSVRLHMNVLYPAALAVSTFSAVQEFEATGAVMVLKQALRRRIYS